MHPAAAGCVFALLCVRVVTCSLCCVFALLCVCVAALDCLRRLRLCLVRSDLSEEDKENGATGAAKK